MREDKFKIIKNLFLHYLEGEADKINSDFKFQKSNIQIYFPPNDKPEYGYFSIYISTLFHKSEFEGADNLSLGILAYDWMNKFTFKAEICWETHLANLKERFLVNLLK